MVISSSSVRHDATRPKYTHLNITGVVLKWRNAVPISRPSLTLLLTGRSGGSGESH